MLSSLDDRVEMEVSEYELLIAQESYRSLASSSGFKERADFAGTVALLKAWAPSNMTSAFVGLAACTATRGRWRFHQAAGHVNGQVAQAQADAQADARGFGLWRDGLRHAAGSGGDSSRTEGRPWA